MVNKEPSYGTFAERALSRTRTGVEELAEISRVVAAGTLALMGSDAFEKELLNAKANKQMQEAVENAELEEDARV